MKELPYFRFTCQEWDSGDISLENHSTKGLFIDICSYYWLQNCDITLTKLRLKVAKMLSKSQQMANKRLLSLTKSGIMDIDGDRVRIRFLDQQMAEITKKSHKLSEAGKRGVEIREEKKKATLKPPLSIKDKDKDNEKDKDNTKSKKLKMCFFKDSDLFDKYNFKARFPDWEREKLEHWYNSALEWSGGNGKKKADWGLTLLAWERKTPFVKGGNRPKTFNEREDDRIGELLSNINNGVKNAKSIMELREIKPIQSGDNKDVPRLQ